MFVCMGILDVKNKRTVTADFSQLWRQQNRKEIAELSTIGRNHRLTELTFKLLSEKSKMSHSSENVRSLNNKKERQGHFDSLIGKSRLGQIGISFLFFFFAQLDSELGLVQRSWRAHGDDLLSAPFAHS